MSNQNSATEARDASHWAKTVSKLHVGDVSALAAGVNVEGKQLTGPLRGFGQMWQRTFRVRLPGVNLKPAEVIKAWRENFPTFWPKGNKFYGSVSKGIAPGEVAVLHLGEVGGQPLMSTGIYVIYADDESFAFMTPEGHPIAGMNTFSAFLDPDDCLTAQVQCLLRAGDPIYEIGMKFFGMKKHEDEFWLHTMKALAAHFGVDAKPEYVETLVDPKWQWKQAKNIWHNAGARTALYTLAAPLRRLRKRGKA